MSKRFSRLNQLWLLTLSLFRELIREPGVLFWGLAFPILMSVGLGLAFTKKANVVRKVAVISESQAADTNRSIVYKFLEKKCEKKQGTVKEDYKWKLEIRNEKLGNSTFLFYELNWDQSMILLKRGTLNLILKGDGGKAEYHFDPMNPDAELTYIKLSEVVGSEELIPPVKADEIRPLTVKGTRYIDFLIPGLITMGVMMSAMWGISYSIIEKRSKKLLRRMVATPMKKSHFLIALISVRIFMNFIEAFALLAFALIVFHMTIQGSISAMVLLYLAGNIAFAGIAVFVSSHTSNTEVGNGIINAIVMPMMVLSGIFFSYHNFPDWSIRVIDKLPLTMLTDGIRSIFNEGAGLPQVALPVVILTAMGFIFFGAGLKIFKWY
ncbi:MAG: ABC transporter permease [Bacteroidales bacterium]|jgi:ABC-type multidrug transport system permease subunit